MPVIGIDLGCLGTKVATIGRGGVGIVRNDLADRVTPTLVGYTDNERLIGDAALTSLKSNANRTVRNMKHYLGLTPLVVEDEQLRSFEETYNLAPARSDNEHQMIGFELKRTVAGAVSAPLSAVEVLVPFLKKVKLMASNYIGAPATDCVLAIPNWFSDVHRQHALEACSLAGIGCLRLLSHSTATALDYGLFRRTLFKEDEDHIVVFIDTGYAQTTVTVVSYKPSKLTVLACEERYQLGGRTLDRVLINHLREHFKTATGIDVSKNGKAMLKIEEAAEKAKRVLSANRETTVHLECLAEDEDLSLHITREEFEKLTTNFYDQLEDLVKFTMAQTGLQSSVINGSGLASIEIVGGGTRVPAIQARLEKLFNRPVSRTLSADECVARGAAVQAAMLDPRHRVAPYEIRDFRPEGIALSFNGAIPGTVTDERHKPVRVQGNDLIAFEPRFQRGSLAASRLLYLPTPNATVTAVEFDLCGWTDRVNGGDGTATIQMNKRKYQTVRLELTNDVRAAIKEHADKCRFEIKVSVDVNGMASVNGQMKEEIVSESEVIERIPKRNEKGEIIDGEFDEVKTKKPKTIIKTHKLAQQNTFAPGFLNAGHRLRFAQLEEKETQHDEATAKARLLRNEILSKALSLQQHAASSTSPYEKFFKAESRKKVQEIAAECELFVEENEGLTVEEYQVYADKLQQVWEPIHSQFRAEQEELERQTAEANRLAEEAAKKALDEAQAAAAQESSGGFQTDDVLMGETPRAQETAEVKADEVMFDAQEEETASNTQ